MRGGSAGLAERKVTEPSACGFWSEIEHWNAYFSGVLPAATTVASRARAPAKMSCTSGRSSSGRVRANKPAELPLTANAPPPVKNQRSAQQRGAIAAQTDA